jgi:hypothetical protein
MEQIDKERILVVSIYRAECSRAERQKSRTGAGQAEQNRGRKHGNRVEK